MDLGPPVATGCWLLSLPVGTGQDGTGRDRTGTTGSVTRVGNSERAKECGMPHGLDVQRKSWDGSTAGGQAWQAKQRQKHGPQAEPTNQPTRFDLQQSGFLGSALCFEFWCLQGEARLCLFAALNGVPAEQKSVRKTPSYLRRQEWELVGGEEWDAVGRGSSRSPKEEITTTKWSRSVGMGGSKKKKRKKK